MIINKTDYALPFKLDAGQIRDANDKAIASSDVLFALYDWVACRQFIDAFKKIKPVADAVANSRRKE